MVVSHTSPTCRRVTGLTLHRESCGRMIGIGRRGICRTMAGTALGWCSLEVTIRMACGACHRLMRADEGKGCQVMIKTLTPREGRYTMALRTLGRESCRTMVGILRCLKIIPMTADARCSCSSVLMRGGIGVTRFTIEREVSPDKGKASLLVFLNHIHNPPRLRRVAPKAGLSKLTLMHVRVARQTPRVLRREPQSRMT